MDVLDRAAPAGGPRRSGAAAGMRQRIEAEVQQLVGFGAEEIDLRSGDAGLFGPGSVSWRVHADFTSMMIGGIASLLLQMLHPSALAGVWDHSNFRADMLGRLRRTAQFISGTTYGSSELALRLIARVRAIHDRVHGTREDGTPYSANDPALLNWVHVAETSSFLAAYLRYREPGLSPVLQDRYYAETAIIAEHLGARDVPRSRREVAAFLERTRPALVCDHRTREVAQALLAHPAPNRVVAPLRGVMMGAAVDLLPPWAAAMHGLNAKGPQRHVVRAGARGIGSVLRWAMRDGSARRARQRVEG